jgi:hypothetical protein
MMIISINAIFNANNQYEFKRILPVGRRNHRSVNRVMNYELTDLAKGEPETFELSAKNISSDLDQAGTVQTVLLDVCGGIWTGTVYSRIQKDTK